MSTYRASLRRALRYGKGPDAEESRGERLLWQCGEDPSCCRRNAERYPTKPTASDGGCRIGYRRIMEQRRIPHGVRTAPFLSERQGADAASQAEIFACDTAVSKGEYDEEEYF